MFDYTQEKRPKYWHSNSKGLFKKASYIYGLYEVGQRIVDNGYTVIVEGNFDVLALWEAGVPAIATQSSFVTDHQAFLISQHTNKVITWFDNDDSGISATKKSQEVFLKWGIRPEQVEVKTQKDPADVLAQYGPKHLREIIEPVTLTKR